MAKFYLINSVRLRSGKVLAGRFYDAAVDNTTEVLLAGGLLWPASDARVSAAAAQGAKLHLLGRDDSEIESLMQAAINGEPAAPGGVVSIVAGDNVDVDATDPAHPIVSAAGGVPAGSAGAVQFNAAGVFAADSALTWDNVLKALNLGMTGLSRLNVSAFDATVNVPTNFSATPVVETTLVPASITGVTQVNGPDDPSGLNGAINDPDGNGIFLADSGANWTCNVWTTLTVNGTLYMGNPQSFDFGPDANDSNPISFSINWTAATIGDGYVYQLYQNGGIVFTGLVVGIGATGTVVNNASIPGALGASFASNSYPYIAAGTPPPPVVSASCGPVYGSGPYTANNNTYSYVIDSLATIAGVEYASGSPTSAGSFTDDNSSNPFYVEIDAISGGGTTDNSVIQGQINGGGFFYFFGGAPGISNDSTGGVNDPAAQAAWLRTYGGPVAITHSYDVSGVSNTPATYYSAGSNGFNYPAFNSPTGYQLFVIIDYSGATATQKLRGSNSGVVSNSQVVSATSVLDRPGVWGGDDTITPKHVGVLGDGRVFDFQFYGKVSSPATLYSSGFLAGSYTFPNDGVYRFLNVNWTTAVGATTTKILVQLNGGGFTAGYQSGFMQGLLQIVGTTTFPDGTTITPNNTPGIAGLFQNGASTSLDAAQVRLKSTGGSASKLEFVNSSDAFCAAMGVQPSTLRTQFDSVVGLWDFITGGTTYNTIGADQTTFNTANDSGYQFRVKGSGGDLFTAYAGGNSVAIGSVSGIGLGTLFVQPRDDRTVLYLRSFSASTQNLLTGVKNDNTPAFAFDYRGFLSVGNVSLRGKLSIIAGDANNAPMTFDSGTLNTTPQNGAWEYFGGKPYFTPGSNVRQQLMLGPAAGLTSTYFPAVDSNGFLSDSCIRISGGIFIVQSPATVVEFKMDLTMDSGKNVQLNGSGQLQTGNGGALVAGTGSGWKFGTATNQKMGFWNVTPIVQPATTGTTTGFTAGSGTASKSDSTFTGGSGTKAYTVGDIVLALKSSGLMAAS